MRIVIPIKPLAEAKTRLSAVLSPTERSALAIELLDRALAAALPVAPVSVVTAEGAAAKPREARPDSSSRLGSPSRPQRRPPRSWRRRRAWPSPQRG